MSFPDKEWILWAKRFQIEHINLLTRVKAVEELAAKITSLEEETKDLAASSNHLQEQNNVLKDRLRQLEEDAVSREPAYRKHSEQLKTKVASLEDTISRLIKSEKRWRESIEAKCTGNEKEIQGLRISVKEQRGFVKADPPQRVASSQFPRAETKDDSMQIDEQHKAQPKNTPPPDIRIKVQGDEALEEYVKYGTSFLAQEIRQHDIRAAKAFVSGMKSEYYRVPLWEKLEKMGWSTRNAVEEAFRMVEDGKRRKRKRERLLQQLR